MKNRLSQKLHGNKIFSVHIYKRYKYDVTLLSKKQNLIFSQKYTPQGDISCITEKDHIHPRKYGISIEIQYRLTLQIDISTKVSNDFLYFYGDLFISVFIYCFATRKKQEN